MTQNEAVLSRCNPVSPTSMDASCLAHRWAALFYHSKIILKTSVPVCEGACLQQQLVPACASHVTVHPHSCASLQPQLCTAACLRCLCFPFHAVTAALICCPPEALYGCSAVAREEWRHCSTATMCWPWLTGQMASCWHLLPWMARSTCGTLKKLSSWYVL